MIFERVSTINRATVVCQLKDAGLAASRLRRTKEVRQTS